MGKNTKEQIKAEIKDGKLIIDGKHELRLEGLKELIELCNTEDLFTSVDDVVYSISRIACEMNNGLHESQISCFMGSFPQMASIAFLKVLSDSLKKM
jgi:hypothetical protein